MERYFVLVKKIKNSIYKDWDAITINGIPSIIFYASRELAFEGKQIRNRKDHQIVEIPKYNVFNFSHNSLLITSIKRKDVYGKGIINKEFVDEVIIKGFSINKDDIAIGYTMRHFYEAPSPKISGEPFYTFAEIQNGRPSGNLITDRQGNILLFATKDLALEKFKQDNWNEYQVAGVSSATLNSLLALKKSYYVITEVDISGLTTGALFSAQEFKESNSEGGWLYDYLQK